MRASKGFDSQFTIKAAGESFIQCKKARGEVQIKDLIEGAKAAAAIASNQEWRETRPAQFAAREDALVEAVRDVLARHDVVWSS